MNEFENDGIRVHRSLWRENQSIEQVQHKPLLSLLQLLLIVVDNGDDQCDDERANVKDHAHEMIHCSIV